MKTQSVRLASAAVLALLFLPSIQISRRVQGATGTAAPAHAGAGDAATARGGGRADSKADVSAEIGKIRLLETAMMTAGEGKGADGYMSFYADDAVELPAGAPLLQGKDAIAKTMAFLNDKNNRLTWTSLGVDVAASRDLAYSYGVYEFHSNDKDGKAAVAYGKYTTVWKKQSDGSWKVVLDMGNANPKPEGRGLP
jgi:uncharacterized protein (TIGR02246 family)